MENASGYGLSLVLLALAIGILYMHFSGGAGLTRLYLAGLLTAVGIVALLPSFNVKMPDWMESVLAGQKIELGLDLQGGTHLLLGVKLDAAVRNQLSRRADDLKADLTKNKIAFDDVSVDDAGTLIVKLKDASARSQFVDLVQGSYADLSIATAPSTGTGVAFALDFKPRQAEEIKQNALEQARDTIANRIDQLGVRETTVAKEGDNGILVQLPGVQDPEQAKELIGKTAVLEFKLIDDSHSPQDALQNGPPPGDQVLYGPVSNGGHTPYLVEKPVLLTGDTVTDATVRPGTGLNGPEVEVDLNARGGEIFDAVTAANVGRKLAIILDNTVYSDPVIKERIPEGHVRISGNFTLKECHDLAIVLKSGRLPAPVEFEEERTVGPSLGRDSIRQGVTAFAIGALAVLIFMVVYYDQAGFIADCGLTLNILLLMCVMAALGSTLTLPGIAGIVLTLGMSVDANVLVNERMREELRGGKSTREAVRLGYQRAWSAIRDSNISTFAAGLILLQFGTGPVKGFAVTLCAGVVTGLFSCIVVTRAWYDWRLAIRKLDTISV